MARNELKYVAEVVTDFGDLPTVVCYQGAVGQVVLNLLVNAAYAVGKDRDAAAAGPDRREDLGRRGPTRASA